MWGITNIHINLNNTFNKFINIISLIFGNVNKILNCCKPQN